MKNNAVNLKSNLSRKHTFEVDQELYTGTVVQDFGFPGINSYDPLCHPQGIADIWDEFRPEISNRIIYAFSPLIIFSDLQPQIELKTECRNKVLTQR